MRQTEMTFSGSLMPPQARMNFTEFENHTVNGVADCEFDQYNDTSQSKYVKSQQRQTRTNHRSRPSNKHKQNKRNRQGFPSKHDVYADQMNETLKDNWMKYAPHQNRAELNRYEINRRFPAHANIQQNKLNLEFRNSLACQNMTFDELCIFRTSICPRKTADDTCYLDDCCPFSHCLSWHRRNPKLVPYGPTLCPNVVFWVGLNKKMRVSNHCMRGRLCVYSHTKEEQMYHPAVYKTQICRDCPECFKHFCPFAHGVEELRSPSKGQHLLSIQGMQYGTNRMQNLQLPRYNENNHRQHEYKDKQQQVAQNCRSHTDIKNQNINSHEDRNSELSSFSTTSSFSQNLTTDEQAYRQGDKFKDMDQYSAALYQDEELGWQAETYYTARSNNVQNPSLKLIFPIKERAPIRKTDVNYELGQNRLQPGRIAGKKQSPQKKKTDFHFETNQAFRAVEFDNITYKKSIENQCIPDKGFPAILKDRHVDLSNERTLKSRNPHQINEKDGANSDYYIFKLSYNNEGEKDEQQCNTNYRYNSDTSGIFSSLSADVSITVSEDGNNDQRLTGQPKQDNSYLPPVVSDVSLLYPPNVSLISQMSYVRSVSELDNSPLNNNFLVCGQNPEQLWMTGSTCYKKVPHGDEDGYFSGHSQVLSPHSTLEEWPKNAETLKRGERSMGMKSDRSHHSNCIFNSTETAPCRFPSVQRRSGVGSNAGLDEEYNGRDNYQQMTLSSSLNPTSLLEGCGEDPLVSVSTPLTQMSFTSNDFLSFLMDANQDNFMASSYQQSTLRAYNEKMNVLGEDMEEHYGDRSTTCRNDVKSDSSSTSSSSILTNCLPWMDGFAQEDLIFSSSVHKPHRSQETTDFKDCCDIPSKQEFQLTSNPAYVAEQHAIINDQYSCRLPPLAKTLPIPSDLPLQTTH